MVKRDAVSLGTVVASVTLHITFHIFFALIFFYTFFCLLILIQSTANYLFSCNTEFPTIFMFLNIFLTTWNVFQHWCDFIDNQFCQKSLFNFIDNLPVRQHWWFYFGVVSVYCWILKSKEEYIPFLQFDVLIHSDLLIFLFLKTSKKLC